MKEFAFGELMETVSIGLDWIGLDGIGLDCCCLTALSAQIDYIVPQFVLLRKWVCMLKRNDIVTGDFRKCRSLQALGDRKPPRNNTTTPIPHWKNFVKNYQVRTAI